MSNARRRHPARLNALIAGASRHSVVSTRDARAAGVDDGALKRRVGSGQLTRSFRGVHQAATAEPTAPATRATAAIARARGRALCLWSANHALGIEPRAPRKLHVLVHRNGSRAELDEYCPHRLRTLRDDEVVDVAGVPVTTAARTLRDFAATLSARSWQSAYVHRWVEEALMRHLLTIEQLEVQVRRERAPHVRARLRRLSDYHAGRGTEDLKSRGEAWLRDFLEQHGFPQPLFNARLPGTNHDSDAYFPDVPLALEFDSYSHHWTRRKRSRDARRQRRAQRNGIPIWPITADDLAEQHLRDELEEDLAATLSEAAARKAAGHQGPSGEAAAQHKSDAHHEHARSGRAAPRAS